MGTILKVKKLAADAMLPRYAHEGDAGMDVFSGETVEIEPGASRLVHTGIAMELPEGTEAQVRPRSGLAAKYGVTVLNSPGTIDAGYRGEVCVILVNHGRVPFVVEKGMRIAQVVVAPILRAEIVEADSLSRTARGRGGFGSTGTRQGGPQE